MHEKTIHGAVQLKHGERLRRQLLKGGKPLLPWGGVAIGRAWVVRFAQTIEGSNSDSAPNSAAKFILKRKTYLRVASDDDDFLCDKPKKN